MPHHGSHLERRHRGLSPHLHRATRMSTRLCSSRCSSQATATAIALVIGLSFASFLAFRASPVGRTAALSAFNAGMALPPVVVGLFVAIMLWRTGPLGQLHLLYSPRRYHHRPDHSLPRPCSSPSATAGLQSLHPRLRLQIAGPRRLALAGRPPSLPRGPAPIIAAVIAGVRRRHLRGWRRRSWSAATSRARPALSPPPSSLRLSRATSRPRLPSRSSSWLSFCSSSAVSRLSSSGGRNA